VAVLKQAELGIPVAEVIRQVGVSKPTLYLYGQIPLLQDES
jgi:hypothetical protein